MSVAVVALLAMMLLAAPLGEPSSSAFEAPSCSEIRPCLPSPLLPIAIGGLLAALFVGWVDAWTGAVAGTVFGVGSVADAIVVQASRPTNADVAVMVVFLVVMWTLAWVTERELDAAADLTRLPSATGMVPKPAVPRAIGGRAWRTLWLAGAVACLATGVWQQVAAGIRQDRADIVTAVVDDYVEDYAKIRLALPGGDTAEVQVDSVWDYPRHSEIKVYADDAGMVRPVAEPYDATAWLTPASALLILGVAQHRRRRRRQSIWSRFFGAPQPTMRAWFSPGTGLIYSADAVRADPPLARGRSMQWSSRAGSGFDGVPLFPGLARGTVYGDLIVGGPMAFTADDLPIVVTGHFGKARHTTASGFVGEHEAPDPGER